MWASALHGANGFSTKMMRAIKAEFGNTFADVHGIDGRTDGHLMQGTGNFSAKIKRFRNRSVEISSTQSKKHQSEVKFNSCEFYVHDSYMYTGSLSYIINGTKQ